MFSKYKKLLVALVIRSGVMGVQFLVSILVALVAGPIGSGIYGIYNAWLAIFSGVAGLGAYTHALRTVSVLRDTGGANIIASYLRRLVKIVFLIVCIFGGVLTLFNQTVASLFLGASDLGYVILFAVFSGAVTILIKIGAESLKALNQVNTALTLEWVVVPVLVVLTLSFALVTEFDIQMSALLALRTVFLFVVSLAILYVLRHVIRLLPKRKALSPPVSFTVLAPFWGSEVSIVWFMNIPYLILPYFASAAEVGIFSVAQKLILTATSILVVLSSLLGPKIARAYSSKNVCFVRQILFQSQLIAIGLYTPLFIIFLTIPDSLLGLFGEEFREGASMLTYMAVGQFVYVVCGLGDFTLHMIGRERLFMNINILTTLLLGVLCVLLGEIYGVEGIAVGFAVAIAVKQVAGYIGARICLSSET